LKQDNIHQIEQFLMDISHPSSPNYGKHWSPKKVAETFAPKKESTDAVRDWLRGAGFGDGRIMALSKSRGWLEMNATVGEVERLLETKYHVYSHELGGQHIGG
jgi:tripeptidyl-peptidase-1